MVDQDEGRLRVKLEPIKAGWAARGDGWAVHGVTREEAERKYREAVARHEAIAARTTKAAPFLATDVQHGAQKSPPDGTDGPVP